MTRWLVATLMITSLFLAGCTSSGDGDGLDAQVEGNGWVVDVRYPDKTTREYNVTSDPGARDTDGDGLDDFQEFQIGADPRMIDTDRDRLLDGPMQCPEAGSELAGKILEANILEHPDEPGCFLGEARFEFRGETIDTQPDDAHSDNGPQIGDDLTDARELVGWNVTVSGKTYHVFSNPSTQLPDTDGDALHDGHELAIKSDPNKKDTDGDGVEDYGDAAPLGNLVLTVKIAEINLKESKKLGGGADLRVDAVVAGMRDSAGPKSIPSGRSKPNLQMTFDVPEQGHPTPEEPYAAGHWKGGVNLSFWHGQGSNEDRIDVRNGDNPNTLSMTYHAFEDRWSGHAQDGTANGPDAKVWIEIDSRVET